MDFVDRVLALQGACPTNKFSLKCKTGVCPDAVNRWICNVLARGVSELDLCLDFKEEEYRLPPELFVSSTLVKLRLTSAFRVSWWVGSEGTFLPMLKSLDIVSKRVYCDFKIEVLLPCFPVLEDCCVAHMEWKDSDGTVSSATMRNLFITATGTSFRNPRSISFDTPNLLSFTYADFPAEDYPLVNMKNVVEAQIAMVVTPHQVNQVRAPNNELLGYGVVRHFGNVVKLMNGIKNVQELCLHSGTLEVLSLCCDTMPVFNNLKTLFIKSDKDRGWQAMPALLRNCQRLEFLTIEGLVHHVTDKCGDACDCVYRKEKEKDEMDRLTSLPEDVRVHILSFLTTKEAALTSGLSTKWRDLFTLVPSLDFNDSDFLNAEEGKRERDGILDSFMAFVDRVLAIQGDAPIKKLSIKCKTGVCHDAVNRWIRNVLARGVSELDLCLSFEHLYLLPRELFVSSTLVKLRLIFEFGLNWWTGSKGTFIPMLKSLDIVSQSVFYDTKFEMLLPCFPVLEEFRISDMEWMDLDGIFSSATLKELFVDATEMFSFRNPKRVSFDTPNLHSFSYCDLVAEDYLVVEMKKLFLAVINFMVPPWHIRRIRDPGNELLEEDVVLSFGNVGKLMNGIKNVHKLHLSSDTLEVLSLCCESMPVFNNLKMLRISSCDYRGWQAVPVLLTNSPHLETLIIQGLTHHVTDKCGDACDCIYRKEKGRSLRSCPVNTIVIEGFPRTTKEMSLLRHFLDYFPSVKKMKICVPENGDEELKNNLEVLEMIKELNENYSCHVQLCNYFEWCAL